MAVHEKLGTSVKFDDHWLRIGHLRRECDLGVASHEGFCTDKSPAVLVRLSTMEIVRQIFPKEDFDTAILEHASKEKL